MRQVSLLLPLLILATGCGQAGSQLSGEVTYDGQPISSGMITFLPAEGSGTPVGIAIVNGRYQADFNSPGPRIVQVEAVLSGSMPTSSEASAQAVGQPVAEIKQVPAGAVGNNARIEIAPGSHTQDFHLTSP
ncbi:MAG: hypothetical protein AB7K24_17755 [Gemmataceae bacterium]